MRSHSVIPLCAQVDFDQALEIYDIVIGQFVDDDGTLTTWYKFKIHETVSKAKRRVGQIDLPPADLYPVASDEILIWKTGGTVEIDGMELEMQELEFPPFESSKKYLLVLATDPTKQAGTLEVGSRGALIINDDDTAVPAVSNKSYFKKEIEKRYGASISKLKEKLR
jgi:hypothetical protein